MNSIKKLGILFTMLVSLTGCQAKENIAIQNLTAQEFFNQLEAKKDSVQLIDVRTPEEYNEGHLKGAQLVDFNASSFAETIKKLPKDKPVFLYCRSGRRSIAAAEMFLKIGFGSVTNLRQGIIEWQEKKLPVVH